MRVALVSPYSWTTPGGVQRHIAGLARALHARGVDTEILTPADAPAGAGIVPVGRSVALRDNGSTVRVTLSSGAARRTARLVGSARYDLVHVHEPMIPAVSLTALLAAPWPLVGTFHMYASRRRWYRPFGPLARSALRRLHVRLAVSEAARFHVRRTAPGDYRVIPNGLDVSAHVPVDGHHDGLRILFVGRPDERKGLAFLLRAFARLPGAPHLDLAGVSEREIAASAFLPDDQVAGRVHAHGPVSEERRLRLLERADVLCAPSLAGESFGLVLAEGMASGTPVVASAIPGYVDVLSREAGVLVPPGDEPALTAALAGLLADPSSRRRLGEAGRRDARRYDWSVIVDEVLEAYEEATCSWSNGRVSSGSKPMRAAMSSLDGRVPSAKSSRRNAPDSARRHQSGPIESRR